MEKKCSRCKFIKPIAEFYEKQRSKYYPNSSSGYAHQCKQCLREKQIKWRKDNPDKAKSVDLKHSFGISLVEYNDLFAIQEGHCAICNIHQSQLNRSLSVDHDHKIGGIRGLLCGNCNAGLGNFRDNIDFLKEAINYLLPPNQSEVAAHNTTVVDISTKKGGYLYSQPLDKSVQ